MIAALERMCLVHTGLWGNWQSKNPQQRLKMCRELTEVYLEIRRTSYRDMEPWGQELMEAFYVDYPDLIAKTLPAKEYKQLMNWLHAGILQQQQQNKKLQQQLDECPF